MVIHYQTVLSEMKLIDEKRVFSVVHKLYLLSPPDANTLALAGGKQEVCNRKWDCGYLHIEYD